MKRKDMDNMKKITNFLLHFLAVCGFLVGIYYLLKKYVLKDNSSEEEEDIDFDDFDFDDEDFTETVSDNREYVTLNANDNKSSQDDATASTDDFDEIYD